MVCRTHIRSYVFTQAHPNVLFLKQGEVGGETQPRGNGSGFCSQLACACFVSSAQNILPISYWTMSYPSNLLGTHHRLVAGIVGIRSLGGYNS